MAQRKSRRSLGGWLSLLDVRARGTAARLMEARIAAGALSAAPAGEAELPTQCGTCLGHVEEVFHGEVSPRDFVAVSAVSIRTGQSAAVMSQKRHSEALGTGAGGVGDATRWTSWPQSNSPRSRYEGE